MPSNDWRETWDQHLQAVDWSAEWGRIKNLGPLASVLEQRIGPRE